MLVLAGLVSWHGLSRPVVAQVGETVLVVDGTVTGRPINPQIYGVASATAAQLAELNAPLHRNGGNAASRYNWQVNATNRASDWFFESVSEAGTTPGASIDAFVAATRAAGSEPMVTVPLLEWVAKLGPARGRLASFSVSKYGPQTGTDWQWFPDAGNGLRATGGVISGNDPRDAHVQVDPAFQQSWVRHLTTRWGTSAAGGVKYYTLDNEPSLWFDTHRDVAPVGVSMDDLNARTIAMSAAIKAADPGARIVAPEEWGWTGYLYSGADQQYAKTHGWWRTSPDKAAHGGMEYLPWLLSQWRTQEVATGRRVVDVVSVHYYPQGGEHGDDTSPAVQRLRNRSTRSLWDPAYKDESWVGTQVRLIPRLRQWVDTYGTKGTPIAITEYNWGAESHISGALAQADVLGIFGREGLDMAARWTTPAATTPAFKAIKLYRNYDNRKSTFGETVVQATTPDADRVAVFAATRRVDGATTLMALNKELTISTPVAIQLKGIAASGLVERWQLTSANVITRLADLTADSGVVRATLPAQSITLLVVRR